MTRTPLLLVAVLALAGCSSGGTSGAAAPTGTPHTSAAAPSTAPTGVAATPPTTGASAVPAEKNPPGDIPDNIAYVRYANAAGRYSFTHPEGWAETTHGPWVSFTDKLNGVQAAPGTASTTPTVATATSKDVPALRASQAAFELRAVTALSFPGGAGVRIVYRRNSAPDPVTGRQYRDEVEHYELVSSGREVVVELFGPVGADNVDAYKTMITSLRLA